MKKINFLFASVFLFGFFLAQPVFADVTVVSATGGQSISNLTAGASYTQIIGPIMTEGSTGDIGLGSVTLNAPSGFEFKTVSNVTVTRTNVGSGNCSGTGNHVVYFSGTTTSKTVAPSASAITVNVIQQSSTNGNSDNCKAILTWSGIEVRPTASSPVATGNIFKSGTSVIKGITGTSNFGSLVEIFSDTTAPTLSLPATITAEATASTGAIVTYTVSASDIAPVNPPVTCDHSSGSTFTIGNTTVLCSATDTSLNTASGSFVVEVVDTKAPVVQNATDILIGQVSATGAVVTYTTPTATDIVDGSVSVSCLPASGTNFALGTTSTVTCTSTDSHGNAGTSSFQVVINDEVAPVLALSGNMSVEATSPVGAVASFSTSATDNVDANVVVTCSATSGATFAFGDTKVDCFAVDAVGNSTPGSFTVSVVDTTVPVLTLTGASYVEIRAGRQYVDEGATASDIYDINLSIVTNNPVNTSITGYYTVTYNVTDSSGNSASEITRTVRVVRRHVTVIAQTETSAEVKGEVLGAETLNIIDVVGQSSSETSTTTATTTEAVKSTGIVLGESTFKFTKKIIYGMFSDDVKELQKMLASEGFFKVKVTGYFGDITYDALIAYQKKHGIPTLGGVGPLTRSALNGGK